VVGGPWAVHRAALAELLRAGRLVPPPWRRQRSPSLAAGWAPQELPPADLVLRPLVQAARPWPRPAPAMSPTGLRGVTPLAAIALLVLGAPLGKG
jgi:hypothetical protein